MQEYILGFNPPSDNDSQLQKACKKASSWLALHLGTGWLILITKSMMMYFL